MRIRLILSETGNGLTIDPPIFGVDKDNLKDYFYIEQPAKYDDCTITLRVQTANGYEERDATSGSVRVDELLAIAGENKLSLKYEGGLTRFSTAPRTYTVQGGLEPGELVTPPTPTLDITASGTFEAVPYGEGDVDVQVEEYDGVKKPCVCV